MVSVGLASPDSFQLPIACRMPSGGFRAAVGKMHSLLQIEVFWGHEGDLFDPFKQILHKTVVVDIDMLTGERFQVKNVFQYRQYTFQELALLARLSGFEVCGFFCENSSWSHMVGSTLPLCEA
jgi:hypothetical protein